MCGQVRQWSRADSGEEPDVEPVRAAAELEAAWGWGVCLSGRFLDRASLLGPVMVLKPLGDRTQLCAPDGQESSQTPRPPQRVLVGFFFLVFCTV